MQIGMVDKLTFINRFVLHTLHRHITHLAMITCKTNIKIDVLKGGGGKEPITSLNHETVIRKNLRIMRQDHMIL